MDYKHYFIIFMIFCVFLPMNAFAVPSIDISLDLPIYTKSDIITIFGNIEHDDSFNLVVIDPNADIILNETVLITLGEFTHHGSKRNLLGDKPAAELVEFLSNEKQVTGNTPPTFLWHTVQDKAVPVENSLQFATALRKAGVPFALHVYQKGRHGIGLADKPPFKNIHPWAKDLVFWLKAQGFIVE